MTVYLDHIIERVHIDREALIRQAGVTPIWRDQVWPKRFSIGDMYGYHSKLEAVKKPDNHRATCTWTPEECVGLLECVLNGQYVPDTILWFGPDDTIYLADGVHRLSVMFAWINDDWGDNLSSSTWADKDQEISSKAAAQRVRVLLQERNIGFFDDYLAASARYGELQSKGRKPGPDEMGLPELRYAEMVHQWEAGNIGLPILWLKGNYAQAEASVLRYQEEFEKLRVLHNNVFDSPEFQTAHDKLIEAMCSDPVKDAPKFIGAF